jgi:hypothetical protein
MAYEPPVAEVAMTDEHYKRVQQRIRREIRGSHTSSIWLAISLMVLGVFATLWIAVWSTNPGGAERGKLEVAAWGCLAVASLAGFVHYRVWKDARNRAQDVIDEMDTYCYRRAEDRPAPVPPPPPGAIGPRTLTR